MPFGFFGYLLSGSSSLMGYEVLYFFTKSRLSHLELISCAFPVGMCLTSAIGLFLNIIFFTSFLHCVVQIVIAAGISLAFMFVNRAQQVRRDYVHLFSFLGVFGWILFYVYLSSKTIFPQKDKILRTGQNDMMLEISLINSFYRGVNKRRSFFTRFQIPLDHKIQTLVEVLPPFYSALLKHGGFTTRLAMLVPMILLFASISLEIFCLTRKLSGGSEFVGFLSVSTVFLVGGFGYRYYLKQQDRLNIGADFVFYLGSGGTVSWAHPLLHCFLTSRLALLCLSLNLSILLMLEYQFIHFTGLLCMTMFLVRYQSGFGVFFVFFVINFVNFWLDSEFMLFLFAC